MKRNNNSKNRETNMGTGELYKENHETDSFLLGYIKEPNYILYIILYILMN